MTNLHFKTYDHTIVSGLVSSAFIAIVLTALKSTSAHSAPAPFRVVLDPGHGGQDHGTYYENSQFRLAEKDVALAIAKETKAILESRGIAVTLTRDEDHDLPLAHRTALANRLKANLFLSIHLNSSHAPRANTEGVETYILNTQTDASSRRLARIENSVVTQAPDSNAPLEVSLILKDLRLDANLAESKRLACTVQRHLVSETTRFQQGPRSSVKDVQRQMRLRDRGVRQALFHVLLGADMPSALVETGFLAHAGDRKIIASVEGRRTVARALASAVEGFRKDQGTRRAADVLHKCHLK